MAGSMTDVTERKRVEEQLVHDAFHDALTGLPNRKLFSDRLDRALARTHRSEDYAFAVLFMDLDHFKVVNDSLGHVIGDRLLMAVAAKLESCMREADTVARFGGDEFALLLEDIGDVSEATHVVYRIQREVSLPFDLEGYEVFTSASMGIVMSHPRYSVERILRDADAAMYHAKSNGSGGYEVFDTEMHGHALERPTLENEMRRGIEREEFTLYYQPIVAAQTGDISGCEALARWEHPERGLVSPGEFIPIAEETGLVVDLGWKLLRVACEQGRAWHDAGHEGLSVSVNFSTQQFQRPELAERVEEALRDTGMSPGCLAIEVTESTAVENVERVSYSLKELRDLGVRIYIDDFGTGYSSLGYLKNLTADTLKFDRSYIQGLPDDPGDRAIASALITLSRGLGLKMVAEGVETEEQYAYLRELGCEDLQGFFFAKPLPADDFRELLDSAPFGTPCSGHAAS